ncbi:MAG TPA: HAD family hydrolase [Opitutales bacterium]|nr:HAD family hydrolase [Opitutales bacterium]
MVKKIKLLALDIDGVLTDGRTTLGARKPERKRLAFQDLDAINAARRAGVRIALVTGESDGSVDLVAARTGVEIVRRGAKDKLAALTALARELGIKLSEIAYVGDGDRDAPALAAVGFSFAPSNAAFSAKSTAQVLLSRAGGHGAVNEAVHLVLRGNDDEPRRLYFECVLRQALKKPQISARAMKAMTGLAVEISRAIERGRKILLVGEGAETALKQLPQGKISWPAVTLSADAKIQSAQLRALARTGDVVISFTGRERVGRGASAWLVITSAVAEYLPKSKRG